MVNVSVIIPHYNRVDLLKQTLMSVKYQTYQDWEAIIVDDYSNIDCINSIRDFISNEPRIKLVTKNTQPKGAPVSRNMGLKIANGQYVIFLDSDDILAPFALQQRIDLFNTTEKPIDAVIAPTIKFKKLPGDLNEVWAKINKSKNVMFRFTECDTPWNTMSALWDKEFIRFIGGWDETLSSYQDWELHIRALLQGLRYIETEVYDNFYRIESDEQSIAKRHFDYKITEGRFRAFLVVIKQVKLTNNKIWIDNLQSLVIRNIVLLIDQGKVDIATKLLQSYKVYNLRNIDYIILVLIKNDPTSWRYRRFTKIFINVFWKNMGYDPWKVSKSQSIDVNVEHKALQYNYSQLLSN